MFSFQDTGLSFGKLIENLGEIFNQPSEEGYQHRRNGCSSRWQHRPVPSKLNNENRFATFARSFAANVIALRSMNRPPWLTIGCYDCLFHQSRSP